jgi:hypothetical protein
MSTSRRAATAAAIVALALGASMGVATAPAHAAPYLSMSSHITYHPLDGTHYERYVVDIDGMVTLSQTAAQDSINHGYNIALRYWGDDPSSDDLLAGPINPQTVYAAADGLHFQHSLTMTASNLNEDDETGLLSGIPEAVHDDGQDEIYVGSRFLDPSGKTVSLVESNRIVDTF